VTVCYYVRSPRFVRASRPAPTSSASRATSSSAGRRQGSWSGTRSHPLQRAVRADKLTLAALEGTLALYLEPKRALREVPVLRMALEDADAVRGRAVRLAELTGGEVEETVGRIGGGALPLAELPSFACAVEEELAAPLRAGEPPVVGVVRDGRLLLDCRTLSDAEAEEVAAAVTTARG
jgi:L-seryl-tRNA(Ser) seleniumtransferase